MSGRRIRSSASCGSRWVYGDGLFSPQIPVSARCKRGRLHDNDNYHGRSGDDRREARFFFLRLSASLEIRHPQAPEFFFPVNHFFIRLFVKLRYTRQLKNRSLMSGACFTAGPQSGRQSLRFQGHVPFSLTCSTMGGLELRTFAVFSRSSPAVKGTVITSGDTKAEESQFHFARGDINKTRGTFCSDSNPRIVLHISSPVSSGFMNMREGLTFCAISVPTSPPGTAKNQIPFRSRVEAMSCSVSLSESITRIVLLAIVNSLSMGYRIPRPQRGSQYFEGICCASSAHRSSCKQRVFHARYPAGAVFSQCVLQIFTEAPDQAAAACKDDIVFILT